MLGIVVQCPYINVRSSLCLCCKLVCCSAHCPHTQCSQQPFNRFLVFVVHAPTLSVRRHPSISHSIRCSISSVFDRPPLPPPSSRTSNPVRPRPFAGRPEDTDRVRNTIPRALERNRPRPLHQTPIYSRRSSGVCCLTAATAGNALHRRVVSVAKA